MKGRVGYFNMISSDSVVGEREMKSKINEGEKKSGVMTERKEWDQ